MPNDWISHVKSFQAQHGCSYKDALKGASNSYRSMKGSNITKTSKTSGKQFITASSDRAIRAINGSGINRLKKANRWQTFVDSTIHDNIDTANKARKTYNKGQQSQMGMGLSRSQVMKLAKQNPELINAGVRAIGSGMRKALPGFYGTKDKGDFGYEFGYGLKKHKRLSGKALFAAGQSSG